MPQILFICSGNTCRSPMAAAILKAKAAAYAWEVVSAGLFAADGSPATPQAALALRALGLDLSAHRSRNLTPAIAAAADLIITMEAWQRGELRRRFPQRWEYIFTLAELAGVAEEVADPYGGGPELYRRTARQLQNLIDRAWTEIIEKLT